MKKSTQHRMFTEEIPHTIYFEEIKIVLQYAKYFIKGIFIPLGCEIEIWHVEYEPL